MSMFILCLKINRSLFILNVWDFKINHLKKTKKDSSSKLYHWGCLHWSNSPEEYLTESGIDVLNKFFRCPILTKLDTAHRRRMMSKVCRKFLRYRVPFWLYFGNIHTYIHESFSTVIYRLLRMWGGRYAWCWLNG